MELDKLYLKRLVKYPSFVFCILVFVSGQTQPTGVQKKLQQPSKQFDRNLSIVVPKAVFDGMVDSCIKWLSSKSLKEISDNEHRQIMMCNNTTLVRHMDGDRYNKFDSVLRKVAYTENITKRYTDFSYNKGMGYYFPSIQMELDGSPARYAVYKLVE